MSQLYRFQAADAGLTLRIDRPEWTEFADDLHSACQIERHPVDPNQNADLAWRWIPPGHVCLQAPGFPDYPCRTVCEAFVATEDWIQRQFLERLDRFLQIHAAVVSRQGDGWLVCGPSRSGKTSLALALLLAGWQVLTDETAFFTREKPRSVRGLRRNFNIKEENFERFPETADLPHTREWTIPHRKCRVRYIDPTDLSPDAFLPGTSLCGILFPRFALSASRPRLRPIQGHAVASRLIPEITRWKPWALETIANLVNDVPAFDLDYSNPREIPGCLLESTLLRPKSPCRAVPV